MLIAMLLGDRENQLHKIMALGSFSVGDLIVPAILNLAIHYNHLGNLKEDHGASLVAQ